MAALGHHRFNVVGHDVGTWIAHAIAADHPASVARLVVADAAIPGVVASPPICSENNGEWAGGSVPA